MHFFTNNHKRFIFIDNHNDRLRHLHWHGHENNAKLQLEELQAIVCREAAEHIHDRVLGALVGDERHLCDRLDVVRARDDLTLVRGTTEENVSRFDCYLHCLLVYASLHHVRLLREHHLSHTNITLHHHW